MREDYLELLEKMFPNGYIITWIQPNSDPAYSWFNPKNDEFLEKYLEAIDYLFEEKGEENADTNEGRDAESN